MSEYVEVPREGNQKEQAILLLAAAEDLGHDQSVVQTRTGAFYVPKDVADKVSGKSKSQAPDSEEKPQQKAAKKAAKKSTSNKSQE